MTTQDALQRLNDQPLPDKTPSELMELAVKGNASVETMERLMALQERWNAAQAKKAFDIAMAAFQAKCPVIKKRRPVMVKGSLRYRYASMEDIINELQPLFQEFGFTHQEDARVESGPNGRDFVTAVCKVTHVAGHSQATEFKVPVDKDAFMSQQQQFASALTYAKRYAFCGAFGVLTGDQDDDGKGDKPPANSPEELHPLKRELWELLKARRVPEDKVNQYLIDEAYLDPDMRVQSLTAPQLRAVIGKLKGPR